MSRGTRWFSSCVARLTSASLGQTTWNAGSSIVQLHAACIDGFAEDARYVGRDEHSTTDPVPGVWNQERKLGKKREEHRNDKHGCIHAEA